MPNLSVKYDPDQTPLLLITEASQKLDVPIVMSYIASNMMPGCFLPLSTQTTAYRDAAIMYMHTSNTTESVLKALTIQLRSVKDVITRDEITLCEYVATAAYICNEQELVKEVLLRVPAPLATNYLKTLYQAVAIRQWDGAMFRSALKTTADSAQQQWESMKASILN